MKKSDFALQSRAFTVIELLVSLGVILLLTGFVLPLLGKTKSQTWQLRSLSNAKQMATGVVMYAADFKDGPPAFAAPTEADPQHWHFDFGDLDRTWFGHSTYYSLAVIPYLGDARVAVSPNTPTPYQIQSHRGVQVSRTDYLLTRTLYAQPALFNWETTKGRSQFGTQRLTSIQFPSSKGMLYQYRLFHFPQYGPVLACCTVDVPSPVCFADLSAEAIVMRRLLPAFLNIHANVVIGAGVDPRTIPGTPVMDTLNGINGRDR